MNDLTNMGGWPFVFAAIVFSFAISYEIIGIFRAWHHWFAEKARALKLANDKMEPPPDDGKYKGMYKGPHFDER